MGELYLNTGRYEEALEQFKGSKRLNPLHPLGDFQIARVLQRQGKMEQAAAYYEQLYPELGPEDDLYFSYLIGFFADHNIERAIEIVNETELKLPFFAKSLIALKQGNTKPRRELLESLVSRSNTEYISPNTLSWMHYSIGDYEQHIAWFAKTMQDHSNIHFTYDNIYGQRPKYWQNLQTWAQEEPTDEARRLALVQQHRAIVNSILEKMTL